MSNIPMCYLGNVLYMAYIELTVCICTYIPPFHEKKMVISSSASIKCKHNIPMEVSEMDGYWNLRACTRTHAYKQILKFDKIW